MALTIFFTGALKKRSNGFFRYKKRPDLTTVFPALENASLVADEHGQRQLIEGTVIDITERKQAEEAIQASEERYRLLFERNLAGVVRTRLDGSIVECNDAMARMLGFESCQQAMASNIASLDEQPEQRQKLLERLLAGGDVVNEEVDRQ